MRGTVRHRTDILVHRVTRHQSGSLGCRSSGVYEVVVEGGVRVGSSGVGRTLSRRETRSSSSLLPSFEVVGDNINLEGRPSRATVLSRSTTNVRDSLVCEFVTEVRGWVGEGRVVGLESQTRRTFARSPESFCRILCRSTVPLISTSNSSVVRVF